MENQPETFDAKLILEQGWRQGSVFDPGNTLKECTLAEEELLILCTQSCTVISPRYEVDPLVEAMVIRPLDKYNHKSFEATGKNQRKLHLEISGHHKIRAIECDINRRFFFDRRTLLKMRLIKELDIGTQGVSKLAGWIGRSYTRIALPDELVARLKPAVFPLMQKCLHEKKANGTLIHESVSYAYIDWQPRSDSAHIFEINFIFMCNGTTTAELLEQRLMEELDHYQLPEGRNGIRIVDIICRTPDTTFLSDLSRFERFSEWDFLSDLAAIAHLCTHTILRANRDSDENGQTSKSMGL